MGTILTGVRLCLTRLRSHIPLSITGSHLLSNCWSSFASNFGVDMTKLDPSEPDDDDNMSQRTPVRMLLLSIFIMGNIVFMAYRAALTSELSVRRIKLPFHNMEEILDTDFRYLP